MIIKRQFWPIKQLEELVWTDASQIKEGRMHAAKFTWYSSGIMKVIHGSTHDQNQNPSASPYKEMGDG